MDELNALYRRLLQFGLLSLRQAIYAGNLDWAKLEVEMLHNLPTLIGEANTERHRCYWFIERDIYVQRILALAGSEPASRMRTYYEPIWDEMEPLLSGLFQSEASNIQPSGVAVTESPTLPTAATAPAR